MQFVLEVVLAKNIIQGRPGTHHMLHLLSAHHAVVQGAFHYTTVSLLQHNPLLVGGAVIFLDFFLRLLLLALRLCFAVRLLVSIPVNEREQVLDRPLVRHTIVPRAWEGAARGVECLAVLQLLALARVEAVEQADARVVRGVAHRLQLLLLCEVVREVEGGSNLLGRLALDQAGERARGEVHHRLHVQAVRRGGELAQSPRIQLDEPFVEDFAFLV
mmetsp:Transcript_1340/g.2780  ORF Transcript_1340/g.2780 Transcript_1340/m.2780 type:complete len:216 (-) Transcript_1340:220-867(-)